MRAKEIMSSPVTTIGTGSTLLDAARLLINANVSALPVVDDAQSMVGIVSEVDLIRRILGDSHDPSRLRVHFGDPDSHKVLGGSITDLMTHDVVSATEDTALEDVAALMLAHRTKRIPILRGKSLVGVVSRVDLVKAMLANSAAPPPMTAAPQARRDDDVLRTDVTAGMHSLRIPLGGSFDVVVRHGVVHLWGQVASGEEEQACGRAAARVPGVVEVISHLQIVRR